MRFGEPARHPAGNLPSVEIRTVRAVLHVRLRVQHFLRRGANDSALHAILKRHPRGIREKSIAEIARMHMVVRPDLLYRCLAGSDSLDRERNRIAGGGVISLGDRKMGRAALHLAKVCRLHIPAKGEDHLDHRRVGLVDAAPDQRLVRSESFRRGVVDSVVRGEVEKYEVRLMTQHVAIETECAEL